MQKKTKSAAAQATDEQATDMHLHTWGKFISTQHFLQRAKKMIVTGC